MGKYDEIRHGSPHKRHKYIAKIGNRYFYTPEEIRAFKNGGRRTGRAADAYEPLAKYGEKAAKYGAKYGKKAVRKVRDLVQPVRPGAGRKMVNAAKRQNLDNRISGGSSFRQLRNNRKRVQDVVGVQKKRGLAGGVQNLANAHRYEKLNRRLGGNLDGYKKPKPRRKAYLHPNGKAIRSWVDEGAHRAVVDAKVARAARPWYKKAYHSVRNEVRKGAPKLYKQGKRYLKKGEKFAGDLYGYASKDFSRAGRAIERGGKYVYKNVPKTARKAYNSAERSVKRAYKNRPKSIREVERDAKREVRQFGKKARKAASKELNRTGRAIKRDVEYVYKNVPKVSKSVRTSEQRRRKARRKKRA